ncbi:S-linalool synthase-like [Coffea eugenioides]|uniref:S-linalool synthase-like n=1 Tax=Coffea eugenioides TaxID=49369 RepID=UPI000F60D32A|nr:S-linalool synthase-like [Coffea eugenioides]
MNMKSSLSSILSLVAEVKKGMFSNQDIYTLITPSAYDTAWLAMIPDPTNSTQPMFNSCLDWILNNQNEAGFWGESHAEGRPTIDTLPATLACLVALKTWNVGEGNIGKGLEFFQSKAEIILKLAYHHLPRWFVIVFPAMVELAQATGLDLALTQGSEIVLADVLCKRQQLLDMENVEADSHQYYPPLISYLESLPSAYHADQQKILKNLGGDGSLFQSPSATASAYIATGNLKCLNYLKSLVQRCPTGVPAVYPVDEEFTKLLMVDHVQRLGLSEHFNEEIEHILKQVDGNFRYQDSQPTETFLLVKKLSKAALAFRLLRMQGYDLNPRCFCWFLQDINMLDYMEQNCEHLTSVLYTVYRAADIAFTGEYELEEARSFSKKLLEKATSAVRIRDDNLVIFPGLQKVIKHELTLPWITRLDHLEHRMWIEENKFSPLWLGKASFYRLSCFNNEKLIQLASENYKFRQSIYAKELEELKRWSTESGLADMGFGREKTTYCYFAISACCCLPHDSIIRLIVAKAAVLITVADDFYDMEGSITELEALTEAVQRWDGKNLRGHSKTIFDTLDDLVTKTAATYHLQQEQTKFLKEFRDIWRETFLSWMTERTWSDTGYLPSMEEYLETGMVSIAAHTLVLPASRFLSQKLPVEEFKPGKYRDITKLLMASTRLVNDTQSYQKEQADGKMNMVTLHLNENPEADIDDSVAYVKHILDEKTKEFLQIVLEDSSSDMPKSFRHLHLSCMKVFQMFFNSTNLYDSKEDLIDNIKKAIHIPPDYTQTPDHRVKPLPMPSSAPPEKKNVVKIAARFDPNIKVKYRGGKAMFMGQQLLIKNPISVCGSGAVCVPPRF